MGKATKKPEEKKADKPKQHAYYVCDGGTCTCAGAVSPNPVPLHVTSHKKFYILGGKKLVATDKDNGNQNLDFISCKNTSNPNNPQPCKAKIKVQWQKFYKDVTYDADKKHPLLDVSEGTCKGYTGSPVKISIVNHGQTGHGTEKEIAEQNTNALRKLIPLLPAEEPLTKGEAPAVTSITLKANLPINIKEVTSGKEKGKITRVSMEIPDKDQVLHFTAAVSKGNAASVSWNRYGTKKDTDTTPSFDSLLRSFIEYGSAWSIAIPKGYKGVFRVEAYGFSPRDKNCCIDVEVRPDEVLPVTGMDKGLRNVPIVFKSGYLFGSGPTDIFKFLGGGKKLQWKITSGKEELYNSTGSFLPHAGVGVGNVIPGSLTVMFSNAGTYTVTAFDTTLDSSKSFTIKILPRQGVDNIEHNPNNYLRETDTINCKIKQFNVAQNMVNKSLIKWKVYYGDNGAAQLAYKGELPGSAGQTAVSITPLQIQQAFNLPSVKGSYGIEAFGEEPAQSNRIKKAAGADRYVFEVRDNAVTTAPAGPLQIPSGSTGTYKAATLMEVNSAEQNAFVWQVTGGAYTIEPAANQTQEVKITFKDSAEYTITCGLMVKGVNTGNKEVKVKAAPLALFSANWCYNDGYLRTQTGYGEESYAYVELSGLKELSGKLQVWAIAEGLKMEDIVKDTAKYQLLESDLKLSADENKTPPNAHGHVTFKPDKTALLPKLQAALGEAVPQFTFTITLADGNGIKFGAGIDIDKATAFVVGDKTYYQVLAKPEQYLNLTDKELLKAMYFTDTQKKRIQTGYTTYGNTHQLRVHTVNLVGQKLTVRIYRETPNALLDGTYDAKNKTIVIAEQMQEYKDVQPKPDGTLSVDFTLKPEWKEQHKSESMRVFVADVYKTVKDEQGKDTLRLVMSQYNTRDFLPFEIIRNDNQQVGIKILTEEEAKSNDTLQLYKQQYLSTHNALLVVKDLAANKEPQPSPTIVYFEDLDINNESCPRCDEDFTLAMLKKVYTQASDTKLTELAETLNKYKGVFKLNTCARKAHFFAQSLQEAGTDLSGALHGENLNYTVEMLAVQYSAFRENNDKTKPNDLAKQYGGIKDAKGHWSQSPNEEMIGNVAYKGPRVAGNGDAASGDGWRYRGRGLLQITGKTKYGQIDTTIKATAPDANVNILDTKEDYSPKEAALTGMAEWYSENMYVKADQTYKGLPDDKVVDAIVDIINRDTDSRTNRKIWYRGGKLGNWKVETDASMKMVFKVGSCPLGKSSTSEDPDGVLSKMKKLADEHKTYKQETDENRTADSEAGREKMDCSEFVSRYLHELGITSDIKYITTASMTTQADFRKAIDSNNIEFAGDDESFIPQRGDIFVWRKDDGNGHTGVVYKADATEVTILEAIGSSGSADETYNKKNGGYDGSGVSRTAVYQRNGGALAGHSGWKGYFRPINYTKKL